MEQQIKMSKFKKEKFDTDNILGWEESDFEEVKSAMVNARFQGNLPIYPQLLRDYCSFYDKVKFTFLNNENNDTTTI
jgi:hypothetical protein